MSKDLLKEHKLKATPARLAILELFESAGCKALNAEEIHTRLRTKKIDLVTVYRTLTSFEERGIFNRVDLHKDSVCYELAKHHHHHIVCTACGLIEGFDACNIDQLSKKALASSSKFKAISQHSLELFGVCKSCAKA
jgi:Fur family ferric uptake transcriptional regulator